VSPPFLIAIDAGARRERVRCDPSSVTGFAARCRTRRGCGGTGIPGCALSHIAYDASDDVWQGTFNLPAGQLRVQGCAERLVGRELRAACPVQRLEHPGQPRAPVATSSSTTTTRATGHRQPAARPSRSRPAASSRARVPGDWDPTCLRSWLEDPDGDGIYTFETTALPRARTRRRSRSTRLGRELRRRRRPERLEHRVHVPATTRRSRSL
jgi:hypothetical protein